MWQKSKKWPEMTKKICPSTPYLSKHTSYDCVFLLHKFKMMTSPDAFFIFSKFWFSGLLGRGENKGKKWPKMTKKNCLTPYLRNCTSYDCGFWYTCVKWWYLQQFFSFFQKSDFSGFSKFINKCQKEILRCAPPSSYVCDFFVKLWLILSQLELSRTELAKCTQIS